MKLEPVAEQNEQFHRTTTDLRSATELQKEEKLTVKPPTVIFCLVWEQQNAEAVSSSLSSPDVNVFLL